MRVMFESINAGIVLIDCATRTIEDINPAALRMYGGAKHEKDRPGGRQGRFIAFIGATKKSHAPERVPLCREQRSGVVKSQTPVRKTLGNRNPINRQDKRNQRRDGCRARNVLAAEGHDDHER